jgi:trehalose 6-phosphate synthase
LAGVAVLAQDLQPIAQSPGFAERLQIPPATLAHAMTESHTESRFIRLPNRESVHAYLLPLQQGNELVGALLIAQDASYIDAQVRRVWRGNDCPCTRASSPYRSYYRTNHPLEHCGSRSASGTVDACFANGRIRQSPSHYRFGSAASFGEGDGHFCRESHRGTLRGRERGAIARSWRVVAAERLSVHVRNKLGSNRLFVVSNREPYSHVRQGKSIQVIVPASGLVTALQPILCACDGTWVAHGSGDADRETVDRHDRLAVLKNHGTHCAGSGSGNRKEGYYYSFATRPMATVSTLLHTQPIFRAPDWE